MQFCTSNSQCVDYSCCHHGTFQTLNQKTGKEEVIQASACNEEIYCKEDDIALFAVIGLFVWASMLVLLNCCRELFFRKSKDNSRSIILQQHRTLSDENTFENKEFPEFDVKSTRLIIQNNSLNAESGARMLEFDEIREVGTDNEH